MMHKFITEVLTMPYYKNESVETGCVYANHEQAISCVLLRNGFTRVLKKSKEKFNPDILSNCEFVEQPYGTHRSPDFIVKSSKGKILAIEAKSSKDAKPLYNSGLVNPNYLYIFCSKKYNKTTIYKGSMIYPIEVKILIDEHIKKAKKLDKILNEKLKALDTEHRGWEYYTRAMLNQAGGASFTDYFKHTERERIEAETIAWVTSLDTTD